MINVLLLDHKNKSYQKMLYLREETELLICENINAINRSERVHRLNLTTIDINPPLEELELNGYKNEDGLYDKLILEYNQQNSDLLTRWI